MRIASVFGRPSGWVERGVILCIVRDLRWRVDRAEAFGCPPLSDGGLSEGFVLIGAVLKMLLCAVRLFTKGGERCLLLVVYLLCVSGCYLRIRAT
jgi:hypothetical protein